MTTKSYLIPNDVIYMANKWFTDNNKFKFLLLEHYHINHNTPTIKIDKTIISDSNFNKLVKNPTLLQDFLNKWRKINSALENKLVWKTVPNKFTDIKYPKSITLTTIEDLLSLFPKNNQVVDKFNNLQYKIDLVQKYCQNVLFNNDDKEQYKNFINHLIEHFSILENNDIVSIQTASELCSILKPNIGNGKYVRTLDIGSIDTKFIENNINLLELLLSFKFNEIKVIGLMNWLGCCQKDNNWVLLRNLGDANQEWNEYPKRLTTREIIENQKLFECFDNVLIVENEETFYSLPNLPNTLAVGGCGKNLVWMKTRSLLNKNVYYWGDIDIDGFKILNMAKFYNSNIRTVMMGNNEINLFEQHMVKQNHEIKENSEELTEKLNCLNINELDVATRLLSLEKNRLEQEKIPFNYLNKQLIEIIK